MSFPYALRTSGVCCLIALRVLACDARGQQPWPANGPYEPKHVFAAVAGAVHERLEIPINGDPPYWFNVSTIGYPYDPATPEGKIGLNAMTNFIPPSDGRLSTGEKGGLLIDLNRRLDLWYERLLANIAFTKDEMTSREKEAQAKLYEIDPATNEPKIENRKKIRTPAYAHYRDALDAFGAADLLRGVGEGGALSPQQKAQADLAWLTAKRELEEAGADGIAAADAIVNQFGKRDGDTINGQRLNTLDAYRSKNDLEVGVSKPPLSYLIPPAQTWADNSGWYGESFNQTDSSSRYEKHIKRVSGGGGFSLGFITIGGSGGKSEVKESRLNTVQAFSYQFKLKRILIYRPWFDASLLEDRGWTWNKKEPGPFPVIAKLPNEDGSPVGSNDNFNSNKIGLTLIPVQLILAKDVEISCTVSKNEWESAKSSTAAGGGGMFFGLIAIKADSSNMNVVETNDGRDVNLSASQPGVSIVGAISRVVPVAPNPNKDARGWPAGVWKPWE